MNHARMSCEDTSYVISVLGLGPVALIGGISVSVCTCGVWQTPSPGDLFMSAIWRKASSFHTWKGSLQLGLNIPNKGNFNAKPLVV